MSAELVGQDGRVFDAGLGQQDHELLAAVSADPVGRAEVPPEARRDALEDRVAGLVAVGVVDRLEVVDVGERDRQGSPVADRPFDLGEEGADDRGPVRDAGQAVGGRLGVGLGHARPEGRDRPPRDAVRGRRAGAGIGTFASPAARRSATATSGSIRDRM